MEGVVKMLLMGRLKTIAAVLVLAGMMVTAAGWLCHARAAESDSDRGGAVVSRSEEVRTAAEAAEAGKEATFAVVAVDRGRKTVAVVVAGTRAPVLNLPLKENARIVAGGQRVAADRLRVGTPVSLRMDSANRAIAEVRVLAEPRGARVRATGAARPDPPSTREVLRALPRVARGVPHVYEEFRDDVQVVSELIQVTREAPRVFPVVGRARLYRCHWKCTIYSTQTIESDYPFPFRTKRPRVEVVYLARDQLIPAP
jgi:hypothetical protein